jgi:arylsulfatase A-like enzyme
MTRPNIVLFVAEDLDYEGVNCYDAAATGYTGVIGAGNPNFPGQYVVDGQLTPTIDALAGDGFRSTNYYCVSAICTPARYSILTGRYPERNPHFRMMYPDNVQANVFFNIGMTRDETNLAKVLKASGYRTGMSGKWHNFPQVVKLRLKDMYSQIPEDADPRDPGIRKAIRAWYSMALEFLSDGFGWDFVARVFYDNPEPFHPRAISCHNLEWIIEGALEFLEQSRDADQPFFLYVPVTVPHSRYGGNVFERNDPLATPAGMLDEAPQVMMPREEIRRRVKQAGLPDYCLEGAWLDQAFNAVLAKLSEIGKEDDTCVIFTTDHPTAGKETCHLGRLPFIVRWPGNVAPGTVSDDLLGETDLAPTILDIAGCTPPQDMTQDGRSFLPLLTGEADTAGRESLLLEVTNTRALVSDRWKYIANRLPDSLAATADLAVTGWFGSVWYDNEVFRNKAPHNADRLFPHYFDEDQLYDLESDPCEQHSVAGDPARAGILEEMREKLAAELKKLPHPFGEFC